VTVLDVILMGLGLSLFVLSLGFAYACDRLWGGSDDFRLFARCPRDCRADDLPRLRFAQARALL